MRRRRSRVQASAYGSVRTEGRRYRTPWAALHANERAAQILRLREPVDPGRYRIGALEQAVPQVSMDDIDRPAELRRQAPRQVSHREVADESNGAAIDKIRYRRQGDPWGRTRRAIVEWIPGCRLLRRRILGVVFNTKCITIPQLVRHGRTDGLGADVQHDARIIGLGAIHALAVVEIPLRDLKDDGVGRISERWPVEYGAVSRRTKDVHPAHVPFS